MADVSIVIVTHGNWPVTERCLRSLTTALGDRLGQSWEIVVVDNASPDETPERLRQWPGPLAVELLDSNRNFAGGCNVGARIASGETLIFLNNDTEVPRGALEALAEQVSEPSISAAGCRLLFADGTVQHAGVAFIKHRQTGLTPMPQHVFHHLDGDLAATMATFETDSVTAACFAVNHDAFDAVGGFDEGYVNGLEDIDLCLKLRMDGRRIVYRGDIDLIHHEGATRGSGTALSTPEALATSRVNDIRFIERWSENLEQDDELAALAWGAALRDQPPALSSAVSANVVIVGSPSGVVPASGECRSLLLAALAVGKAPCAVDIPVATVVAPLSGPTAALLDAALPASVTAGARGIYVPSGPHDALYFPGRLLVPDEHAVVRLGWGDTALDLRRAERVLVPSHAVADQLVANGLSAARLKVMAPLVRARGTGTGGAGAGGAGVLVVLPTHLPTLAASIIGALKRLPEALPVRLLPTVFRRELAAAVTESLPRAELLAPCPDEDRYALLAADADVVLCADPSDPFERAALVAAAVGTPPLTLAPNGPASEVLGAGVVIEQRGLADALRSALGRPRSPRELVEAVAAACDPQQIADVI